MSKTEYIAKGDWFIGFINQPLLLQSEEVKSIEFLPSIKENGHTETYLCRVMSVPDSIKEDLCIDRGDLLLMESNGQKHLLGSCKAGAIYCFRPEDVICSIEYKEED